MAPGRKAKPLPRPRTTGMNVRHIIHPFGGRGRSFQKTIRPSQEAALLRTGPKITPRSDLPSHFPPDPQDDSGQWMAQLENFERLGEREIDGGNPGHAGEHILNLFPRRFRSRPMDSKNKYENWRKTETAIARILSGGVIEMCACSSRTRIDVRHICISGYRTEAVEYCSCGRTAAALVQTGYFPASPIRGGTAFSFDLLELLSEQSLRTGGMTVYGWAEGLRVFHEKKLGTPLVSFRKLLTEAYHHFINVKAQVDTILASRLNEIDGMNWEDHCLTNLCPPCFAFEQSTSLDRSITISLDGNLQHTRFKDRQRWEFDSIQPKMFVDYGRREYPTASKTTESPCGSHFKATRGWSRSLKTTDTKKALDETGLVVATCYHGTPLRFLNMHGSGERHSHAEAILLSIFSELREFGEILICYDVACVFEAAVWKDLPEYEDKIKVRIGRFHVYAHGLSCQILYSTMRTAGYGFTNGEEPEHTWYQLSPLIRSGRVSSGPHRTQKIDCAGLHIARGYREFLGRNLDRRWKKMMLLEAKANETLHFVFTQSIPARVDKSGVIHPAKSITIGYLNAQIEDQISYYRDYRKPTILDTDEVFTAILQEERLCREFASEIWVQAERRRIAESGTRRARGQAKKLLPPDDLSPLTRSQMRNYNIIGLDAAEHTDELLIKHSTTLREWRKGGQVYQRHLHDHGLRKLHTLQQKIIHVVTERNAEISVVKRRIGQKRAATFTAAINSRWHQLDGLVESYNRELDKLIADNDNERYPDVDRLRKLNARSLKDEGLDNSEVWDVDMELCKSDWAVFDIVRQGIEAIFTLRRAEEEQQRLRLHGERTTGWLKNQIQALVNHLNNPGTIPTKWLEILLLSREKILHSMLRIRSQDLLATDNVEVLKQLRLQLLAARNKDPQRPQAPQEPYGDMVLSLDLLPAVGQLNSDLQGDAPPAENDRDASDSEDDGPGEENPDEIAEEIACALVRQDTQITIEDDITLAKSISNSIDPTDAEGGTASTTVPNTPGEEEFMMDAGIDKL